ncbi:hypothetical protein FPF71_03075 [Algibacter amylolyticus]|uniref:Uncharacterized protein n=1 Tax=Algibacter amylolyticus TaxID=1608400 RepID=A0A5M7BDZ4_9FLAO|nr:hypothetical protein [Algibacter amylolyticus]KAA5827836.1 hypothetical protein F2B50_03075 [Algibacter amylolyticus]MBB5267065.1 hypothetical protein [Algibacter amylolyticus]TSJ82081.1 hypothetical protein FPF71_03075 [Algibacter amylolyticus]
MKKLLFFTVLCMAFFYGHTQNNNYYNRMQYIFGNINKTKVTTGYLKEFGIRFNEVEAHVATKLVDVNSKFDNNITPNAENPYF